MKINRSKILIIACLFLLSCFAVKAQMCGAFDIAVSVKSTNSKKIEDANVQLLPITKDQTFGKQFVRDEKDSSKFSIRFLEGQSITEFHKLIVSAKDYKTAENEIKFASCRGNNLTVYLTGSFYKESPFWQFKNSIVVDTEDADGKAISGVKIYAFIQGMLIETKDSKYYGIGFNVPNGDYTFVLDKADYKAEEIKVDLNKIADLEVVGKLTPKKDNQVLVRGQITDEMASVVPNLDIKLINSEGKAFQTKSNKYGEYEIYLVPGIYRIADEPKVNSLILYSALFKIKQTKIEVADANVKIQNLEIYCADSKSRCPEITTTP